MTRYWESALRWARVARWGLALLLLTPGYAQADPPKWGGSGLRMNQIQVIGTHNSYHQRPNASLLKLAIWVQQKAKAWDYSHAPLDLQLDRGVRSFELDLYHYPDGYQVFHVPMIDAGSSCRIFRDCLRTVRTWSETHPGHVPISFLLEIKEQEATLAGNAVLPVDRWALERLDQEIRTVFPPERLVTPDDVREDHPTLEAAILDRGWPSLAWARNRVFFILHEGGRFRDLYTEGRPSLEGCAMFVRSEPGRPDAATLVLDNPASKQIQACVKAGYWVRTRVDANRKKRDTEGVERLNTAFASGAHILSTDYPTGEADPQTGYVVAFEENQPFRPNPLTAPRRLCATQP